MLLFAAFLQVLYKPITSPALESIFYGGESLMKASAHGFNYYLSICAMFNNHVAAAAANLINQMVCIYSSVISSIQWL